MAVSLLPDTTNTDWVPNVLGNWTPRTTPLAQWPEGNTIASGEPPPSSTPQSLPKPDTSTVAFGNYTPTQGNTPGGYDQTKWADLTHQSPKYIAGRIIAGGGSPQDVAKALGAEYRGGDRIFRSDLGLVDVSRDFGPGGANAPFWNPIDVNAQGQPLPPNWGGSYDAKGTPVGGTLGAGASAGSTWNGFAWVPSIPGSGSINASGQPQIFSDPAAALLEQITKGRLDSLMTPMANPAMDAFLKSAQAQMDQLHQPVYTADEEAALRVKVFDHLERDRQTAIQQTMERMAAMGHGKESGTIPLAVNLVNKHFDELRAQQTNALLTGTIAERQARLREALQISGQVATMTSAQQAQQDARQGQAVTTAAILPNLVDSRLALANSTLGSGGSAPNDLMSTISQLMQETQTNSQNSAGMWASIGQIIADALAGH